MKPIFKQLEGEKAIWMRATFVVIVLLSILAVGWTAFAATHERTSQTAFGCEKPAEGVGR